MIDDGEWITSDWQRPLPLPASIGISLSGGGHRAALLAAGALAAVIDSGLSDRVCWISSASGGSLTSGWVAAHGGLTAIAESRSLVRSLLDICCQRGGTIAAMSINDVLTLKLGKAIERSIDRLWLGGSSRRLEDLPSHCPEHVFLTVDLGSLEPVFLSRSFVYADGLDAEDRLLGRPGKLTLAAAVRASAAFPLMPTVKMNLNSLDLDSWSSHDEDEIVLGDGGLWNNLATAWDGERSRAENRLAHAIPACVCAAVDLHLAIDASAPVERVSARALSVPIGGWARGSWRSAQAMLQSTIDHHRRQLGTQSQWRAGDRVSHVTLQRAPSDICHRSALHSHLGTDEGRWRGASDMASKVRTTLTSVPKADAMSVAALGYGLTAAHLSDGWSVPFARFVDPFVRFE